MRHSLTAGVLAAILLVACGGDDSPTAPTTPTTPTTPVVVSPATVNGLEITYTTTERDPIDCFPDGWGGDLEAAYRYASSGNVTVCCDENGAWVDAGSWTYTKTGAQTAELVSTSTVGNVTRRQTRTLTFTADSAGTYEAGFWSDFEHSPCRERTLTERGTFQTAPI